MTADANSAAVRITISTNLGPRPNVPVYFQNSDSSLVAMQVTNADGVAEAVMQPGGFVTAIQPYVDDSAQASTFAGVKPGDQLVLHRRVYDELREFELVVPIAPNGDNYMLYSECGSDDVTSGNGSGSGSGSGGGPGGRVTFYGCGTTSDLVLEARSNDAISTLFAPAATLANVVDLSALSYASAPTATFNYTNVPAGIAMITLDGVQITAGGAEVPFVNSTDITAGAGTITVARSTLPNAISLATSRMFNGSLGRHEQLIWGAATATNAVDLAAPLLAEYNSYPTVDAATHAVTWTAMPGATPDLVRASFVRTLGKGQDTYWSIVGPYTNTKLVLPVLPGDAAGYNPQDGESIYVEDLATAKVAGGYDAVRNRAHDLYLARGIAASLGASGAAQLQQLGAQPTLHGRGAAVRRARR